jgi:hypothetical protein
VGAEYSYAVPFEGYASAGGQVVSPGPETVVFDTVRLQGCDRCQLVGNAELELLVSGTILVETSLGLEQTEGGRTISEAYIEHQPAAGVFGLVPGSLALLYTRNGSDGNAGTLRSSASIEAGAGDKIRIRCTRRSGNGVMQTLADAVLLRVTFVATNG